MRRSPHAPTLGLVAILEDRPHLLPQRAHIRIQHPGLSDGLFPIEEDRLAAAVNHVDDIVWTEIISCPTTRHNHRQAAGHRLCHG